MDAWQTTTTGLLAALEMDGEAWNELDQRIRPIVFACARRSGLDGEAAADVAQDTLLGFVELYRQGRYERARGRLRHWIVGIARNRIARRLAGERGRREQSAGDALPEPEGDDPFSALWEEEARRALLERALACLRAETATSAATFDAFRRYALEGRAPKDVAQELGIPVGDVYVAKTRCLTRLRTIAARLEEEWELV